MEGVFFTLIGAALFSHLEDVRLPDCAGRGITRVEQLVDPELDHGDHQSRPYYDCYYALGEHLFQNLYATIGPDNFRRAWKDLYLLSRSEARQLQLAEAELDRLHELTESEIYAAFLEHTPAGTVAAFRQVYQELYGADVPE